MHLANNSRYRKTLSMSLFFFRFQKKNRGASDHLVTPLNHSNGFRMCNLLGYNTARPEIVCPCRTDTPRLVLWVASPRPQLDPSESERIDGSKPRTKGIRSAVPCETVITPQRSRRCHRPYVVLRYTLRSTSPIAPLQSGACRVISSTTGEDEPSPIRRVPLTKTTSIRVARGEPPANPLGAVVGLTLGWLAASLEQSIPLTGRGRELGRKRGWANYWSFISFGPVSLRIEGLVV
jgi:hypothetical protein